MVPSMCRTRPRMRENSEQAYQLAGQVLTKDTPLLCVHNTTHTTRPRSAAPTRARLKNM